LEERLETRLRAFLADRVARARREGEAAAAVAETVRDLALRGGKRLRAKLVAAGARAAGETVPSDATVAAGAAVELLQTYLIVHDDWMDGDEIRRGGPTAHLEMARRWGAEKGPAGAILAGDLASAWSCALLADSGAAPDRLAAAWRVWAEMEEDVILGQSIDVAGAEVAPKRIIALKTTSYTVQGPLRLGAVLAGAGADLVAALDRFSAPVGEAFQLRDDVLGLVGDPARTGKPVGADLRHGKRTATIVDALATVEGPTIRRAMRTGASEDEVRAAIDAVRRSGALARSEEWIATLRTAALEALESAPMDGEARASLAALATKMTDRSV